MLEDYQKQRIELMKTILPYFGENFILKGGTALSFYYGLNRYSEDLDFDSKSNNMNFISRLKYHPNFKNWGISIKKDTNTVFRAMINYKAKSNLGDYPLKIEISSRNKLLLQINDLKYTNINKTNVYSISELVKMKTNAFTGRDRIRDFYDLGFLLEKYPEEFTKDSLFAIYEKVSYLGLEELNLLLKDEIRKHKLVSQDEINIKDDYSKHILNQIEGVLTKKNDKRKTFKSRKTRRGI